MKSITLSVAILSLGVATLGAQKIHLTETHRLRYDHGSTACLAFSPDERLLACGGYGGDVAIYEVATKKRILTLDVSFDSIAQLEFFPDGKRIAVGSHDLSIWSIPDGKLLRRCPAGSLVRRFLSQGGSLLAISPDGKWIAHAHDESIVVRDSARLALLSRIKTTEFVDWTMMFSPKGDRLILDSRWTWSWRQEGAGLQPLPWAKDPRPCKMQYVGPNALPLVAKGNSLELGDRSTRLRAQPVALAASSRGHRIAVLTRGDGVVMLDGKLGTRKRLCYPMRSSWPCFALSLSGDLLATAGEKDPVRLWQKGAPLCELPGNAKVPDQVSLDPSGRFLGMRFGARARSRDLRTGSVRDLGATKSLSQGWRAGEFLLTRSLDKKRQIFGIQANKVMSIPQLLFNLEFKQRFVRSFKLYPSTTLNAFVIAGQGSWFSNGLQIHWSKSECRSIGFHDYLIDATWSRDGNTLLCISESSRMCGNAPRMGEVAVYGRHGPAPWHQAACASAKVIDLPLTGDSSPDSRRITWGGNSKSLTFSRTRQGQRTCAKDVHLAWLRYVDNDHFIAHDGQVLGLWRAKDLELLQTVNPFSVSKRLRRGSKAAARLSMRMFDGPVAPTYIQQATVSRDHKRLVLVSNQDVRVYDLEYH